MSLLPDQPQHPIAALRQMDKSIVRNLTSCKQSDFFVETTAHSLFLPCYCIMILRSLLYIIAVILVLGWILGFFVFKSGVLIHTLLVLALISVILGLFRKNGIN